MNKRYILLSLLFTIGSFHLLLAQVDFSVHKNHSERYDEVEAKSESEWDEWQGYDPKEKKAKLFQDTINLKKSVFGWHPYWMGTVYEQYHYELLSDIAYFSYEVDPLTGSYEDIHFWKTTRLIDLAHEAGTRVSLTVTLFDDHELFLENPAAQQTMIDSVISLLKYRDAKGINIDFESISSTQKDNLTQFITTLGEQFNQEITDAYLSIALPAVDWGGVFDIEALNEVVDLFIIMGYNYYWSSSPIAGPVAPKTSGELWGPLNVTRSVLSYMKEGIPGNKLCIGVPYYGYKWKVENEVLPAETAARAKAVIYSTAKEEADTFGRKWDEHATVPFYNFIRDGEPVQTWYDDDKSLGLKYDLVDMLGLAGAGIWALGYDQGTEDLWKLLELKFSDREQQVDGNLYDLGGPKGDYYPNKFGYVLPAAENTQVMLLMDNVQVLQGDTLFIVDREDSLVAQFTGEMVNNEIFSASAPVKLKFNTAGENSGEGWDINWFTFRHDSLQYELSNTIIDENQPAGTEVGSFINHTNGAETDIELAGGAGIYRNEWFYTEEGKLFTARPLNFEFDSSFYIRTRLKSEEDTSIHQNFLISVHDINDPPGILNYPPEVIRINRNEEFSFCLANTFFDEDEGDELQYSSSLSDENRLPEWLTFDPVLLCYSGVAPDTASIDIVFHAFDNAGDSATVEFSVQAGDFTNVKALPEPAFTLFPVPFRSEFYIDLKSVNLKEDIYIEIRNASGQKVFSTKKETVQSPIRINAPEFPPGVYTVSLFSGRMHKWSLKTIKLR